MGEHPNSLPGRDQPGPESPRAGGDVTVAADAARWGEAAPPPHRLPTVLQVLPALVTGGVERGTVDVAAALVAAGWGAVVASSGGPLAWELEKIGARHVTLPLRSKAPLTLSRNVRRLGQVIADHGVSLVHARSRAPAWSARAAAQAAGVPFVTTFHGTYGLGPFGLKIPYNRIMTRGDRVIAISRFIAAHLQEVYDLPAEAIRVIHRGVDLARFDPARVSAERVIRLARAWRLPDDARVIMLPGRLTRWKGHRVLIEALALLREMSGSGAQGADPRLRCLLVGSDKGREAYRAELENLAEKRGVAGQVHIVGDCDDMPAAYMLTDVVVSASTQPEAFGRVVPEAQAMGRPVIAPSHGAAPELVIPGATGWLVPPEAPAPLAEALAAALALDQDARARLAQATRTQVAARYSLPVMTERTLHVYKELLQNAPPLETVADFSAAVP